MGVFFPAELNRLNAIGSNTYDFVPEFILGDMSQQLLKQFLIFHNDNLRSGGAHGFLSVISGFSLGGAFRIYPVGEQVGNSRLVKRFGRRKSFTSGVPGGWQTFLCRA